MRGFFEVLFSARIKQIIMTSIALILFAAALICAIVALTKKAPTGDPVTQPPVSGKITALADVTTEVSYTDKSGEMDINKVAEALISKFLDSLPKKEIDFKIKSFGGAPYYILDYNMDTSSICKEPLSENVWFMSGKVEVLKYTGNLVVDADGYAFIGGRYIVRDGNTYTLYQQDVYENNVPEIKDPGTQPPDNPDGSGASDTPPVTPPAPGAAKWGEYDSTSPIAASEMHLVSGVTLGQSFEDVETILGSFDSASDGTGTKTAQKNGYTFKFTLINSSSGASNDFGLPHDGKYYLTSVTAGSSCKDEFPRSIKIGDTIDSVFAKVPAVSTDLKQWAEQRVYGAYERTPKTTTYAYVLFSIQTATYRLEAQDSGRELITIRFDENNKVSQFEWTLQN